MQNWTLKPCDDINRMLKLRSDLENIDKASFPMLITLIHRYATADDLLFPEATTLAFFSDFEQKCAMQLDDAHMVAQDIDTGLLTIYIYAKNYQKSIEDTIAYLKLQPRYHVEFKVQEDKEWSVFKEL